MDYPVINALWLLQRQSALQALMQTHSWIRLAEEQELHAIQSRLRRYPEALKAILTTAHHLHRPVDALSEADVSRSA